jgi:hypothetical protein
MYIHKNSPGSHVTYVETQLESSVVIASTSGQAIVGSNARRVIKISASQRSLFQDYFRTEFEDKRKVYPVRKQHFLKKAKNYRRGQTFWNPSF